MSEERRAYQNPSVEEAIVEFQFARVGDWDASLAGKLHQHPSIADAYPATPRNQKFFRWDLNFGKGETSGVNHEINRVQLLSPDGKRVVTVGENVIGASTLRPYDGWESVRSRLRLIVTTLHELQAKEDAPRIQRIGVRYINRVVIPSQSDDPARPRIILGEFFNCGPREVSGLPPMMDSFLCRTSGVYGDGAKLTSTFAPIPRSQEPGRMAYLLDIDIARLFESPVAVDVEQALNQVDVLHTHVSDVFEASITDKTRGILDGDR